MKKVVGPESKRGAVRVGSCISAATIHRSRVVWVFVLKMSRVPPPDNLPQDQRKNSRRPCWISASKNEGSDIS